MIYDFQEFKLTITDKRIAIRLDKIDSFMESGDDVIIRSGANSYMVKTKYDDLMEMILNTNELGV